MSIERNAGQFVRGRTHTSDGRRREARNGCAACDLNEMLKAQSSHREALLNSADTAMYEAKRSHSNCFCKEQRQLRRCIIRDDGEDK